MTPPVKFRTFQPIIDALYFLQKNGKVFIPILFILFGVELVYELLLHGSTQEAREIFFNAYQTQDMAAVLMQFQTAAPTIMWYEAGLVLIGTLNILICLAACHQLVLGSQFSWSSILLFGLVKLPIVVVLTVVTLIIQLPLYLLFIIPGLWMTSRLVLTTAILALEQTSIQQAIVRSFERTAGYTWIILVNFFVMFLGMAVFSAVLDGVFSAVGASNGYVENLLEDKILGVVMAIVFSVWGYRLYSLLMPQPMNVSED